MEGGKVVILLDDMSKYCKLVNKPISGGNVVKLLLEQFNDCKLIN